MSITDSQGNVIYGIILQYTEWHGYSQNIWNGNVISLIGSISQHTEWHQHLLDSVHWTPWCYHYIWNGNVI